MTTNYPDNKGDGIHFDKKMKDIGRKEAVKAYNFLYNTE